MIGNEKPEISELHRSIVPKYAAQWKDLGIQLKIPEHHLDIIAANNKHSQSYCQDCCKAMLKKWMEITPDATRNVLQKAIDDLPIRAEQHHHVHDCDIL